VADADFAVRGQAKDAAKAKARARAKAEGAEVGAEADGEAPVTAGKEAFVGDAASQAAQAARQPWEGALAPTGLAADSAGAAAADAAGLSGMAASEWGWGGGVKGGGGGAGSGGMPRLRSRALATGQVPATSLILLFEFGLTYQPTCYLPDLAGQLTTMGFVLLGTRGEMRVECEQRRAGQQGGGVLQGGFAVGWRLLADGSAVEWTLPGPAAIGEAEALRRRAAARRFHHGRLGLAARGGGGEGSANATAAAAAAAVAEEGSGGGVGVGHGHGRCVYESMYAEAEQAEQAATHTEQAEQEQAQQQQAQQQQAAPAEPTHVVRTALAGLALPPSKVAHVALVLALDGGWPRRVRQTNERSPAH
jgi:hypothetical protein